MGRPAIEITDEMLRQAELLAGYGLTQNQIADVLGIGRSTFRRKKDEPRVSSALEKGRANAERRVSKALFKKAIRGDVTSIIWWEKTRAGRSERVITAHEGEAVEINIGRAAPPHEPEPKASLANDNQDKRTSARRTANDTRILRAL